jgi:DNA polymerase-3 subunit gamma/tau
MSYQVLARKWRPRNFKEMVGQEHVLQALVNALDDDRLHHAYLFTGTRGVGKTTVARIFAKCLNCEQGVSSQPCGQCSSCLEIAEGRSVDLIEVDAASRTKVEDTRDLLENVQYAPSRCRYKVYLIDEVHMLSAHSFNALLKTLEEPPPHVKFLLATTDPQKLPVTVLSRCLQFNLKNMLPELIVGHLGEVLGQEGVEFEEPALWLLARSANGSMRDALSLTDQAIAYGSGALREAEVRAMLGTVDLSFVYRLLQAVAAQDAAAALKTIDELSQHAPDYAGTLQETVALLHRVAVAQAVPDAVDNSWGDAEQVMSLASAMSAEDVQLYYQVALSGRRDIEFAADLRSGLEMTLLRMIAFRPAAMIDESLDLEELKDSGAEAATPAKKPEPAPPAIETAAGDPAAGDPAAGVSVTSAPAAVAPVAGAPVAAKPLPEPSKPGTAQTGGMVGSPAEVAAGPPVLDTGAAPSELFEPGRWAELLERLQIGGIVYNVASHMELRQVDGGKAYLVLDEANASLYNENHAEQLAQALGKCLQHPVEVHVEIGAPRYETPAARAQRLLEERLDQAVTAIEQDPKVQLLLDQFEGTLERDSITPIKH